MAIFYAKISVLSITLSQTKIDLNVKTITLSQIKIDLKIINYNSIANKMLEKFIKL